MFRSMPAQRFCLPTSITPFDPLCEHPTTTPAPACPHQQVNQGKDAMPPFRESLSPREIEAVAAYVLDQAAGDKW